jgi:Fic family protein
MSQRYNFLEHLGHTFYEAIQAHLSTSIDFTNDFTYTILIYKRESVPMPFIPKYNITKHLLRLLENITVLKTKIESSTISVSWVPRLTKEAFSRMAHSSTAIEGNPLTLREVEILAEGGNLPQASPRDAQEILNYFAALQYITKHKNKKSLSIKDVFQIHRLAGKDVLDRGPLGEFRSYQVYVGQHVPPKSDEVSRLMDELLEWLNGEGQALPAVLSSSILHYQFEFIHPFGDGNGRVGRILATWELYRRKFDTYHILSIDEVFWENRQRYYRALDNVRAQNGDLTGWLEFVSEAIELTLERAWLRIESINASNAKGESFVLTPKQETVLTLLRSGPLSIKEIQEQLRVTKPGAHYILKPLIERNLIKRAGGHKTGKYILI